MTDSKLEVTHKTCTKCQQLKPLLMFSRNKARPDGYCYQCKSCDRDKNKKYYWENKEKVATRQLSYNQENKEKRRAMSKRYRENHRTKKEYVLRLMLIEAKKRAKSKELPFDLTVEWLEAMIVSHCPITLQPIDWLKEQVVNGSPSPNSPSIDRIIPELGYVQSNCAIISHRANAIKNSGTIDEHRRVVQYMAAQQLRDTEF